MSHTKKAATDGYHIWFENQGYSSEHIAPAMFNIADDGSVEIDVPDIDAPKDKAECEAWIWDGFDKMNGQARAETVALWVLHHPASRFYSVPMKIWWWNLARGLETVKRGELENAMALWDLYVTREATGKWRAS